MRRAATIGVVTLCVLIAGLPAARASDKRGRLILNGAFGASSIEFSEVRKFQEFVETASVDTRYESDPGPGFEAGLQYNFTRRLGVAASFGLLDRDQSLSYDASLPHPLFFDRSRSAKGDLTGLSLREQAIHLDLVVTGASGPLDLNLFAGATFFKIEADLLDRVVYSQAYPFDSVTVTSVPTVTAEDSPVGFNLGARVDYRIGSSFGLGAQVRFSRATAELSPVEGQTIEVDAGGLQLAGGVRIFF